MGPQHPALPIHPIHECGATAPCPPCPRVWGAGVACMAALVYPLALLTVLWEPLRPVAVKHQSAMECTLTCSAAHSRAHTRALPSQCRTWGWWSTWRNTCHRRSAHMLGSDAVRQSRTGPLTTVMTTQPAHQPELPWPVLWTIAGMRTRTNRAERWETCRKLSFSHHLEERN